MDLKVAPDTHLAGFADALAVLSHGTSYAVQPSSNDPRKGLGGFKLGFTAILALPQAYLITAKIISQSTV